MHVHTNKVSKCACEREREREKEREREREWVYVVHTHPLLSRPMLHHYNSTLYLQGTGYRYIYALWHSHANKSEWPIELGIDNSHKI